MANNEINCKMICSWLVELDLEGRSYSGRGMYGRSCLGITVDRDSEFENKPYYLVYRLIQVAIQEAMDHAAAEEEADAIADRMEALDEVFKSARQDSMGLGYIIYFEDVEWQEPDDEDESPQD